MTDNSGVQPAGWYYAQGDPPGTHRYWDGTAWVGGPEPIAPAGGGQPGALGAGPQLASLGARIGARIIDAIILGVINLIVSTIIIGTSAFTSPSDFETPGVGRYLIATLVGIGFAVLYEGVLVANTEATFGKMALGLKIKRSDGSRITLDAAIKRYAIWGALALLGVFGAAGIVAVLNGLISLALVIGGMIMISTDSLRQAPWDKIGDTIVVKE